jgi:transcription termination factor Rho
MSVLDRSELEASPLADLHAIADQVGLDGFRRLRKAELIDAILGEPGKDSDGGRGSGGGKGSGESDRQTDSGDSDEGGSAGRSSARAAGGARKRRTPRLRRGARNDAESSSGDERESSSAASSSTSSASSSSSAASSTESSGSSEPSRRGRGAGEREGRGGSEREGRGGRGSAQSGGRSGSSSAKAQDDAAEGSRAAEGVVELLGNGSAFLRVDPPEPSDEDVYISAAQVRRCELVSGDRVTGPVRTPRRSERYPSLVRVDTINGTSADEVSEGARYEDLPVAYPSERIALNAGDPTLDAIEWLTPLGRGSRVVIVGPARAGKTETLRRLLVAVTAGAVVGAGAAEVSDDAAADALAVNGGSGALEVTVVLAGVRPEEVADWQEGPVPPVATLSFAASADAQGQAVERALDGAKRVAARGGDALVLIDGLDGMHPPAARKALAAARNLREGGSLTVIATATRPFGGETTVIALDAGLTGGDLPNLDLAGSGTLKPELLVGEDGAKAIAKARAEARS